MELKKTWFNIPVKVYLFKLLTIAVVSLFFGITFIVIHDVLVSSLVALALLGFTSFVLLVLPIFFEEQVNPIEATIVKLIDYTTFIVIGFIITVLVITASAKFADYNTRLIIGLSVYVAAIVAGFLFASGSIFRKVNSFLANIGSGIIQAYLVYFFLIAIYNNFK